MIKTFMVDRPRAVHGAFVDYQRYARKMLNIRLRQESMTCNKCEHVERCLLSFDPYNRKGKCLMRDMEEAAKKGDNNGE